MRLTVSRLRGCVMGVWVVRFVHQDPTVGSDFEVLGVEAEDAAGAVEAACAAVLVGSRGDYRITVRRRSEVGLGR